MKPFLILIVIVVIAIAGYFIFFDKKKTISNNPKQEPLAQGANSDTFNIPFNNFLNSYFELKNALVNWDTAAANTNAKKLTQLASQVPYKNLKADTSIIITAQNFSDGIVAESEGLTGDTSINEKRHSFYTLSEDLYNLIRTVHYDQQVIYHDKCPMAFNDSEEGYWLTNAHEIINPYIGNKHPKYHSGMVGCGNIEDSINFVKKVSKK